eukprot:536584-Pelagomonas_calceolata.AAC.1
MTGEKSPSEIMLLWLSLKAYMRRKRSKMREKGAGAHVPPSPLAHPMVNGNDQFGAVLPWSLPLAAGLPPACAGPCCRTRKNK